MTDPPSAIRPDRFLRGGGEMGERMRAFDWSRTPVGPIEQWPPSLRSAVSICLQSRQPTVIWWGNPAFTAFYNDAYIPLLGAANHPASLGCSGKEHWPAVWPAIGLTLENVFASGEPIMLEDMLLVLDRKVECEQACFTFSCSPIFDDVGAVGGVFCTCHERAACAGEQEHARSDALAELPRLRREAEVAVQLAMLIEQSPVGTYLVDADFRIRQANPIALPVFGDIPGGVEGRDFAEIIGLLWDEERARKTVGIFRRTLATGEPYHAPEAAVFRIDRQATEYYDWRVGRLRMLDGRDGLVCYFRDISEQVRARQRLADSERRLRFVLDSMPQKIFTASPDGDVDYFNPQWMEFTGLSFDEIKGWGWKQFIHPDDVDENVRTWQNSIETGEPFQFEHRFRRADGEYRWHYSRALAMRDGEGEVLLWVGSNTDVDDIKRANAALREADRRKDEFLATLAHELRNPLAPIRNSLHILRLASGESGTVERVQEMMERQVSHLVRLVDDLMEVSRITRGKIALRKERVELAGVVRAAVETSKPLIEAARHQLAIALPAEPISLDADPVRLAQVLANLLNNAAKYTDEGGQIWLAARADDGEVTVSVRDTGVGIAPDVLPHVFDLFTQADRSLHRSQGGLGIGLTLVRNLVEMHGGSVAVKSDGLGQGSEFSVRLPLAVGTSADAGGGNGDAPAAMAPRRVLVVDDNYDAAESLSMLLRFLGADVRTAHDGPAALEALPIYQPAVIVLDIGMPDMDGFELARRIRQRPEGRGCLLIALTGWGQEEDRRRSQEAGIDHHLIKPVDVHALQALLAPVGQAF